MVLVSVGFGQWRKKKKNLQRQVWLHQICQVASLSLEFPTVSIWEIVGKPSCCGCKWTPLNSFPLCRCLWLSITFKMLKVEQIVQPVTLCWLNYAMNERLFYYFPKNLSPKYHHDSAYDCNIVSMRLCYKLGLMIKALEVSRSLLLTLCSHQSLIRCWAFDLPLCTMYFLTSAGAAGGERAWALCSHFKPEICWISNCTC